MIATRNPAPYRKIRLNRPMGGNSYLLKKRFAELSEKHSVGLIKIESDDKSSWTEEKDARRCQLIDKSLHVSLNAKEQRELKDLQRQAEAHFDEVAPPPIAGALKLHQELMDLKESSND